MGKGPRWFKHWDSASDGLSIQGLLANGDHEAVCCYWILLELTSKYTTDDNPGHIEIPVSLLCKKWYLSRPKVERILARLSLNMRSTFKCTLSDTWPRVASITVCNWLECNNSWGGKREARFEQEPGRRKKIENRYIPPPSSALNNEDLAECVKEHELNLKQFNITRSAILSDQSLIGRAIQKHGADAVKLALVGARREPKNEKFDPAKYYSLNRILKADALEKFVNLGSQNEEKPKNFTSIEELKARGEL